jgi:hypothetical protein
MLVTSRTIYGKVYCSAAAHTGRCLLSFFFYEIYIPLPILFTGQHSCLCCHHIVHSFSCFIATCVPGFFHKSDFHNSEQFSPAVNYTISKVAVASTRRLSLMTENRSLRDRNSVDDWLLIIHTGFRLRGRRAGAAARCTIL